MYLSLVVFRKLPGQDWEVLTARRSDGTWDCGGGAVLSTDEGSLTAAALRLAAEHFGIQIKPVAVVGEGGSPIGSFGLQMCTLLDGYTGAKEIIRLSSKYTESRWVKIDEWLDFTAQQSMAPVCGEEIFEAFTCLAR